jgi:hypothetical protein
VVTLNQEVRAVSAQAFLIDKLLVLKNIESVDRTAPIEIFRSQNQINSTVKTTNYDHLTQAVAVV